MVIRSISFSTSIDNVDKSKKERLINNFFNIAKEYFNKSNFIVRTKRLNLSPFFMN